LAKAVANESVEFVFGESNVGKTPKLVVESAGKK
jgi:hypothetical protein